MRQTPLFGGLADEGLRTLLALAERHAFVAGATLFSEGDAADALFVIEVGEVKVYKSTGEGKRPLVDLGPGDFFGEMGFADMQARAGTVCAKSDIVTWRFPYLALRKLYIDDIKSYTLLVMNIARELSRRLRRADARFVAGLTP